MLTVDFLETLDRFLEVALLVHEEHALVIELLGRFLAGHHILLGERIERIDPEAAAGGKRRGQKRNRQQTGKCLPPTTPGPGY
jgi:hypothetical protein